MKTERGQGVKATGVWGKPSHEPGSEHGLAQQGRWGQSLWGADEQFRWGETQEHGRGLGARRGQVESALAQGE